MYGKLFASTFTGSMFGAGPTVFAVWGYVIAHAVESTVELNPSLIAATLGADPTDVGAAIDVLCSEDPRSRTKTEGGRRLIHESGFQYRVVNHAAYRSLRNEDDRRAYNREAQRKHRKLNSVKRRVNDMSALSAHTEAEAEADPKAEDQERDAREAPAVSVEPAWRSPSKRSGLMANESYHRRNCPPWAWDACQAGICLPKYLWPQWEQRFSGETEALRAFVADVIASTPPKSGDRAEAFWPAHFERAFGATVSTATGRKSAAQVTIETMRRGGAS